MKNVFKSALILVIFALVSGVLLAVVNKLTYMPYTFSMTAEDKDAIRALTASPQVEILDHMSIAEVQGLRVVMRAKGGADNGNYLIRSAAPGRGGQHLVETYTMIDTSGTIKKAVLCIYEAGNNYIPDNKIDPKAYLTRFVGKTALPNFNGSIDGISGATETSNGLYTSVKISLDYFIGNKAALASATVSAVELIGDAPADPPITEAMKKVFDAVSHTDFAATASDGDFIITAYLSNLNQVFYVYAKAGTIDGTQVDDAQLLFTLDDTGEVDEVVNVRNEAGVDVEANADYKAAAITDIESLIVDVSGNTVGITQGLDLGANGYLLFMTRHVAYTSDYGNGEYDLKLAIRVKDDAIAKITVIDSDGNNGFVNTAIDGNSGATYTAAVLAQMKPDAIAFVAGLNGGAL